VLNNSDFEDGFDVNLPFTFSFEAGVELDGEDNKYLIVHHVWYDLLLELLS